MAAMGSLFFARSETPLKVIDDVSTTMTFDMANPKANCAIINETVIINIKSMC